MGAKKPGRILGAWNLSRPFSSNRVSCPTFSVPRRAPLSIPSAWPQVLDFFGTPLVIEPSPGQFSSDAGLVPIRQFDQRVGPTRAFADALENPRDPDGDGSAGD